MRPRNKTSSLEEYGRSVAACKGKEETQLKNFPNESSVSTSRPSGRMKKLKDSKAVLPGTLLGCL